MQAFIGTVTDLDNITEMEKYYMPDDILDNANASVVYAWPNATEDTRTQLLTCQEALNNFNSAADNINYEIIDKLKMLTDDGINADDDCLYELRRLNETNSLQLVPCSVAERARAITNSFKSAAFAKYSATKIALVPNIDEMNKELESLTAALIVNPNELGSRITAFTATLIAAKQGLENSATVMADFIETAKSLTSSAEAQFKDLSIGIKNLSPKLAAEIAAGVTIPEPAPTFAPEAAADADLDLPEDLAEDAELAAEAAQEGTPKVSPAVAPEVASEVAPEITPAAAPIAA